MESTTTLAEQFIAKLESLHGHGYQAADWASAADIVLSVCRESEADCVALGNLAPELTEAVTRLCEGQGIHAIGPKYKSSELPDLIDGAQVGVGAAECGIAQTATLVETALDDAARLVSALPRTYVGIVRSGDLVERLEDSAGYLRNVFQENDKNCVVSFISGPSRTGDIEMILTLGVHGPKNVHVVVVDEGAAR